MAQQGFMQPGAGFGAPMLAPDIAEKQYQLAQRQAYAQALMQQANEPLQGQNVGGHYVAPSWTQGLAKALGGYMGIKAMSDMPKQQQEIQQMQNARLAQSFGLGQPSNGQGAEAFPVSPGEQGGQGGQAAQPQIPLLPGRTAQESFVIAQGMGLPAYLKMAAEQGYQKPLVVGEGGTVYDPMSKQPQFSAAKNGIQTMYGPNGPQASMVPGYGEANAAIRGAEAGAVEGAKAQWELVDVPDGRGGTIKMPRGQAAQLLSGGPQSSPPPANAPVQTPAPPGGQGKLGTTISPRVQEARQMLPKVDTQVNSMVSTIDQILNHKGLDYSVGVWGKAPTIPGTPQADVRALQDQIQGQAFLQAFESLKGGGAITEVEGKKAEQAIARLQSTQSPPAYRGALKELRDMLETARDRAYKSADTPRPGAGGIASPKTAQEMQALPSGTVFRAPDGSLRKVP